MKNIYTFFLLTFLSITLLFGQDNKPPIYHMKALGSNIGTVALKTQTDGENVYYQHETLIEVDLLVKEIKVLIQNKTHYRGGQLITSKNKVIVNGELNNSALTEWKGNYYDIKIDGETKPKQYNPITSSGTTLYFGQPSPYDKVFSEGSGNFMEIETISTGTYKVTDPGSNRKMIFYYDSNLPYKVEIKHPVLTISLIRQDERAK
jgi:hypothetical protein